MQNAALHHVSLTTKDLEAAAAFYEGTLGFKRIARPAFPRNGIWLKLGAVELHLIDYAEGSYRSIPSVHTDDVHFAIRIADFDGLIKHLANLGYTEELEKDAAKRVIIKRNSMAGYHQLYIMDFDRHLIEINAAL